MKRRNFLATLAAMVAAPFVGKALPKEPKRVLTINRYEDIDLSNVKEFNVTSKTSKGFKDVTLSKEDLRWFKNFDEYDAHRLENHDHIYSRSDYRCIFCGKQYE